MDLRLRPGEIDHKRRELPHDQKATRIFSDAARLGRRWLDALFYEQHANGADAQIDVDAHGCLGHTGCETDGCVAVGISSRR